MTLTEFLQQRLDEDEASALAVVWDGMRDFHLADVAFKRKAVEFYRQLCDVEGVHKYVSGTAARQAVETVLLDMAAVYADHPDYRQEWAS